MNPLFQDSQESVDDAVVALLPAIADAPVVAAPVPNSRLWIDADRLWVREDCIAR